MRSPALFAALILASVSCAGRASHDSAPTTQSKVSASQNGLQTQTMSTESLALTSESCRATTETQGQAKSGTRWLWIVLGVVAVAAIVYLVASSNDDGGGYFSPALVPAARQSMSTLSRAPPVCPSQ
jgi:hypothetical protein